MKRRDNAVRSVACIAVGLAFALGLRNVRAAEAGDASAPAYEAIPSLAVAQCRVKVRADRPFKVLHVSDSHVVRVDSRDTEAVRAFALARSRMGRELGDYYLDEAVFRARQERIPVVHTGDMIACHGAAGLEYAARRLKTDDIIACVGNHEYWLAMDRRDVPTNKAACQPALQAVFGGGARAYEREINGVLFFVFNNASQLVEKETVEAFERTVAKGKPIVMVCHVPLCTEDIRVDSCGWPGGKHDRLTVDFVERVRREPLVKAVLAGHIHARRQSRFSATAVEYVADALFHGGAQEISFGEPEESQGATGAATCISVR